MATPPIYPALTLDTIITGNPTVDELLRKWRQRLNQTLIAGTNRFQSFPIPSPTAANDGQSYVWSQSLLAFVFGGGAVGAVPVIYKNTNFTAQSTAAIYNVDASGGAKQVRLPSGIRGLQIVVNKTDGSSNQVTINSTPTQFINPGLNPGQTSAILATPASSLTFVCGNVLSPNDLNWTATP